MGGVILAVTVFWCCSTWVLGRLLDGCRGTVPFELVKDGDPLLLIERLLHLGGPDTVRITRVKGHVD